MLAFNRQRSVLLFTVILLILVGWTTYPTQGQPNSTKVYYIYVAAETESQVALVWFDGTQAEVVKRIDVGSRSSANERPKGLAVSPNGENWYVSIAQDQTSGRVVKYRTGSNELAGQAEMSRTPSALHLSPETDLLYVAINGQDETEAGAVSVIDPTTMKEVAQTPAGIRLHGSRLSPDGHHHYSVSTTSGTLYEIDARTFQVTRTLFTGTRAPKITGLETSHIPGGSTDVKREQGPASPQPTSIRHHPTLPLVYVANNGTAEIVEVNTDDWTITRRFETEAAPYNLDVTPDGRYLIATQQAHGTTGVFNLKRGEEVVRLEHSHQSPHSIAISPDSRYAFISAEGQDGESGVLDIIDLKTVKHIATLEVGPKAGDMAFWKIVEID